MPQRITIGQSLRQQHKTSRIRQAAELWGFMKGLTYLFKGLSWIVIAAIVIYLAIAAPVIAGFHPVVVLSGSMEPAFPVGSIVYYHACRFEELKDGDVVTFRAENSLVTHRITAVNGISRTLNTKGDNNPTEDPVPVEEGEVVGKATDFAIPFAGYFVTYGKQPAVIAVMAVILLIDYVLEKRYSGQKGEEA